VTADLPEGWEAWLAYFAAALPQPVEQRPLPDGSVVFQAGDPREVIVHLMPGTITVSQYVVSRLHDEELVVARPVGRVLWRRLFNDDATAAVEALIAGARAVRRATFQRCEVCEQHKPPEAMADEVTCRACARLSGR
jgi:hypothetical protein